MDEIVKIKVFGEEFRFKPENQDVDSEKIVEYLKHSILMAEDQIGCKYSDKNKIAILLLAGMNMSKDFNELKMKYISLEDYITDRALSLIKKIDNEIQEF